MSIYAYTPELPLPHCDEVLYCNSRTTSEEVENFLRIAFAPSSIGEQKIFCLVNIQDISYENSMQIDKFLSSRSQCSSQTSSNEYSLVCICCAEKKEQSVLVSSLLKHKVNPIVLPAHDLQKYLLAKFCLARHEFSRYDPDGSCVRALLSKKPSNGKSMYVQSFDEALKKLPHHLQVVRIKTNPVDMDAQVKRLVESKKLHLANKTDRPTIFHVDIAFEVFKNVDLFLFNLLVMGFLKHTSGYVWKKSDEDFYFIEMMPPYLHTKNAATQQQQHSAVCFHSLLNYVPKIDFRTPRQYLYDLVNLDKASLVKMKDTAFERFFTEKRFQRTCLYISLLHEDPSKLGVVNYENSPSDFRLLGQIECLKILLENSELKNPNWAELHNFVCFLDKQIEVLENATLLQQVAELRFLISKYLIMMSYDFGLPSLNVGDDCEIFNVTEDNQIQVQINKLEIARLALFLPFLFFESI